MAKQRLSLSSLAKELSVETDSIVAACRLQEIDCGAFTEHRKAGRTYWKGPLRIGLAETIREWHRQGHLRPYQNAAAFDDDVVSMAVTAADRSNSFTLGFGEELDAICGLLEEFEVDLLSARGRKLAWRAWETFANFGGDWERWVECTECHEKYRPIVNRAFVRAYADGFQVPYRKRQKTRKELFLCSECSKR